MEGYGWHSVEEIAFGGVVMLAAASFKADFAPLDSGNGKAGTVCAAGG
jgi:hypothetical protein